MRKGNAHDYVQDESIDPRPMVNGPNETIDAELCLHGTV